MKTVDQLKIELSGLLQGRNLTKVTSLNEALERAARTLAQQADIPEATARQPITLYNGVFDYVSPTNIFGGALIDLSPQGNSRSPIDYVYRKPVALFDRTKHLLPNGYSVAFKWDKGIGIARIATPKTTARTILSTMTDKDDWTVGGSMGTIQEDETVFYDHKPALRFTLTGASTGTMEQTLANALDIPTYEDVCVGFIAIRTPSASNLTSIALRVGSDSSNYDQVSDTEGFLGAWVADDWLLVALDFSGATSTGTPNWEAIDYVQVRIAHGATLTNFYVGGVWLSLPSPHEMLYQTAAIFKDTDGNLSNSITDDTDQIILSDSAYNLYLHECALTVAYQSGGSMSSGVIQQLKDLLHNPVTGLYPLYRADNPSAEIREIGNYYDD